MLLKMIVDLNSAVRKAHRKYGQTPQERFLSQALDLADFERRQRYLTSLDYSEAPSLTLNRTWNH
jgi:hypothetical protein